MDGEGGELATRDASLGLAPFVKTRRVGWAHRLPGNHESVDWKTRRAKSVDFLRSYQRLSGDISLIQYQLSEKLHAFFPRSIYQGGGNIKASVVP